ncbi:MULTISPECIES: Gfo/Idh/MocA family oxidoreductase [Pectobacteriaceae]|uniref:Gfo/Idh/MocA family oxidoreductase n=1 Tax=Affinibrenneria salicis TaxID=2590031 RepID=A0A5J5FS44_9GAMM|nr:MULTISPECIES: Gfo/Idh/MocA family oxidoreductase [Pectobacteriaceae]MEE3644441.1 Gfo/Idh/MocA family oxidoreductase [Brenneria sp. L3_3C_1]MEE3652003.1 Gfo/Idh/MocA family oxidoreductase [Brenneria sp. HEZEL_4_2_4]MEE3663651.1 Gfo/Idh/MocA family oxidoreductase [Brenneria sp. g21c3]KAA8995891.1 Gfo/Idh/MocA family oxidoreductase [Affinibrenneria salicis]MBJ7223199.1 Gfo/Idh/MocA family oxidoreductase [Brenneria sp. L3-3C-1]
MKLGILGTGMIVKDWLLTVHKLPFRALAILGTPQTEDETRELATRYQIDDIFFDYQAMLDSDVDTIYVALPNHLHFLFASKALQKGKHVIIEKPITTSMDELSTLKGLATEHNVIMLEAMNIHSLPAYLSLQSQLASIGNIKLVTLNYSQYSSRYDDFMAGIVHPAFDVRKGGGALMDINVYNLHFVAGLFGEPKAVNYVANVHNNIDTSGMMLLDYGDFKCVCIAAKDCKAPTTSLIQGDKGNVQIPLPVNQMTGFDMVLNNGDRAQFTFNRREHRLLYEFQTFICIIDTLDYQAAARLLDVSTIATRMIESGKKQLIVE